MVHCCATIIATQIDFSVNLHKVLTPEYNSIQNKHKIARIFKKHEIYKHASVQPIIPPLIEATAGHLL